MKQWRFKMKKLCPETLKSLINELNRPGSTSVRNVSGKSYLSYNFPNINNTEIFYVLLDKVALLTRRRSELGKRNCHQKIFRKVLTMFYIENVDQKMNFIWIWD